MPLIVTLTRYSLVKGERIVRYVIITRLRDFYKERSYLFICELHSLVYEFGDVGLYQTPINLTTSFHPLRMRNLSSHLSPIHSSTYLFEMFFLFDFIYFKSYSFIQYLKARTLDIH